MNNGELPERGVLNPLIPLAEFLPYSVLSPLRMILSVLEPEEFAEKVIPVAATYQPEFGAVKFVPSEVTPEPVVAVVDQMLTVVKLPEDKVCELVATLRNTTAT